MTTYQKISYLGIAAFIALCVTVFLGIAGLDYRLHMAAGIVTAVFAVGHVAMVIYSRMKK